MRSPSRDGADRGFLLVESIVAMAVIMIVMTALAMFLASVTRANGQQRTAQAAARLAVAALDRAHAVGAAGSVSGRDAASTATQFSSNPVGPDHPAGAAAVAPWLAAMTPAVDGTAPSGAGAGATLPTVATPQTLNGLTYHVSYFVGYCYRDASATGDCVATGGSGAIQYVRVVVVVAWPNASCGTAGCSYVSATLLNGSGDPVFDINQAKPRTLAVDTIPSQSTVVNRAVDGITGVSGCDRPCPVSVENGAPPLTFSATGLPAGLNIDRATGVISGTPTAVSTATVTVSVADAFLGSAQARFTWKVTRS